MKSFIGSLRRLLDIALAARALKKVKDLRPQFTALFPAHVAQDMDRTIAEVQVLLEGLDCAGRSRLEGPLMVVADTCTTSTSDEDPEFAAFMVDQVFLDRLVHAVAVCRVLGLSQARFGGSPTQWGEDRFEEDVRLQDAEVVVTANGGFWFEDHGKDSQGDIMTRWQSVEQLIQLCTGVHESGRALMLSDSDAVAEGFSRSRARLLVPLAHVIYSRSEDAFWSNDYGWTSVGEATTFGNLEEVLMPMSAGGDAVFMLASDAMKREESPVQ